MFVTLCSAATILLVISTGIPFVLCHFVLVGPTTQPSLSVDLRTRTEVDIRQHSIAKCFTRSSDVHRPLQATDDEPFLYATIIDAGSSGSRIWTYRWPTPKGGGRVALESPELEHLQKESIEPGLSDHAESLASVKEHIGQLLAMAVHIPEHLRRSSPVYVMATAGMRKLSEAKANAVMDHIKNLMLDSSFNPFLYRNYSVRILASEEEGLFAWIAVNYLNGAFDAKGPQVRPVGIIEMGGTSTQIAFEPEGDIMQDKFPVLIGSSRYELYVHSYLNFGTNAIIRRVKKLLIADRSDTSATQVANPCMLKGNSQRSMSTGIEFIGTGDPNGCVSILNRIVLKVDEHECEQKPCGIGQNYQPSIPVNLLFYAVGSFQYTLPKLGAVDDDDVYVPRKGFEKAFEFCGRDYNDVIASTPKSEQRYVSDRCIIGLYSAVLFTRGYGFLNDTKLIRVNGEIKGRPHDWPLGGVLYEDELDACSQGELMTEAETSISVIQSDSIITPFFNSIIPFFKYGLCFRYLQNLIYIVYLVTQFRLRRLNPPLRPLCIQCSYLLIHRGIHFSGFAVGTYVRLSRLAYLTYRSGVYCEILCYINIGSFNREWIVELW